MTNRVKLHKVGDKGYVIKNHRVILESENEETVPNEETIRAESIQGLRQKS